jgi:hypothetical protein
MIEFSVPMQPFDALALRQRGFPAPVVEPLGRQFIARTRRSDGRRLEVIGHTPEVAVHQLARLAVRQ